jgi:hypothetical protein
LGLTESFQICAITNNEKFNIKKILRVKALSGGIQAPALMIKFTCCADKHGSVECDKVSWEWGNRGYMQIEEERSENWKSGNLGHVHLILCVSYFNRYEAEYPGTHR